MPKLERGLTSRRVGQVRNSLTLEITSRAADMRAAGQDVVAFAAGEPDFDVPDYVKEAALRGDPRRPRQVHARDGARRAPTARLEEVQGRRLPVRSRIRSSSRAAPSTRSTARSTRSAIRATRSFSRARTGTPTRTWCGPSKRFRSRCRRGSRTGFEPDACELRKALSPKSRALILNSPNNPTGAVYSSARSRGSPTVVREAGLIVISDDIYEHLIFGGESFTACSTSRLISQAR